MSDEDGAMMRPLWRRVLIASGFILGVAILGFLAFNAWAILTEDNESGSEPEVAESTPITASQDVATPTATAVPIIDAALSAQCYQTWDSHHRLSLAMCWSGEDAVELGVDPGEYLAETLGPDWLDRLINWNSFWEANCITSQVLPVPQPHADLPTLCIAAKVEKAKIHQGESSGDRCSEQLHEMDIGRLGLLEAFTDAHCD